MKKILACIFTFLIIATGCSSKKAEIPENVNVDELVSNAILERNDGNYFDGEASGEGHIILGTESDGKDIIVYAIAMFANFGFEDMNFVKVSGHGAMPVKMVFDKNLGIKEYIEPEDGAKWQESIKEFMPKEYLDRVVKVSQKDRDALDEQTYAFAQKYLDSIGREAIIGSYSDFKHTILTDVGVSVNASNEVSYGKYSKEKYPYWIGTKEYIEDGVRYVYEMSWTEEDAGVGEVKFSKYEFATNNVVEEMIFEVDGENANYRKVK